MTSKFEICNGPSKFDIMSSFFVETFRDHGEVHFHIEGHPSLVGIQVQLRSLTILDTGKNSWAFKATMTWDKKKNEIRDMKGEYDSRSRKGWLEFQPVQNNRLGRENETYWPDDEL